MHPPRSPRGYSPSPTYWDQNDSYDQSRTPLRGASRRALSPRERTHRAQGNSLSLRPASMLPERDMRYGAADYDSPMPLHGKTSPISPTEPKHNDGTHALTRVVHATHSKTASQNRYTTYLIATYTGMIDEYDHHELWWDEHIKPHTEAEVYVEIFGRLPNGTERTSGEQLLAHAGDDADNIFREGSVDEFAISCRDLGEVHAVCVRLGDTLFRHQTYRQDNDGRKESSRWKRAMWKLDKVVVTCLQHDNPVNQFRHRRQKSKWSRQCCSKPEVKGDHVSKSTRTTDSVQWHFVPPHAKRWIGTKDPDGIDLDAAQQELHFLEEDYKEIEKQWQQIQQEFEESKRKVQAQRETVAIMNQQRLALDREGSGTASVRIDLDDDSSPGRPDLDQLRAHRKAGVTLGLVSKATGESWSQSRSKKSWKPKMPKKFRRQQNDARANMERPVHDSRHIAVGVGGAIPAPALEPEPEVSSG